MTQVFNFSAGPAMMPREVLEQAQAELLNWQGQHTSVMEVSHRGKLFMELITQAEKDFRTLYHIPDNYKILFLQGGARGAVCRRANEFNWRERQSLIFDERTLVGNGSERSPLVLRS